MKSAVEKFSFVNCLPSFLQEKKSNPLTFFGLTSTILHEKRHFSQKEVKSEEKCFSQDKETFDGKQEIVNYSSNDAVEKDEEEEEESVSE